MFTSGLRAGCAPGNSARSSCSRSTAGFDQLEVVDQHALLLDHGRNRAASSPA
jgi:hypothetical protein